MKIIHVPIVPFQFSHCTPSALSEFEIESLKPYGFDLFAYWYVEGDYDGSGNAIIRQGDQWFTYDLGHCSCYGPLEHLSNSLGSPRSSLEELFDSCTPDLRRYIRPLMFRCRAGEGQVVDEGEET